MKDGDLKIENNHLRGDYREYFFGPLKPHYLARGVNGEIYSVHAPGLPAVGVRPAGLARCPLRSRDSVSPGRMGVRRNGRFMDRGRLGGGVRDRARPGAPVQLFVRNSAIDNAVVLESGRWRQDLALKSREERLIEVPIDTNGPGVVLRVRSATGARPADADPGNQDKRMLGCWIETR